MTGPNEPRLLQDQTRYHRRKRLASQPALLFLAAWVAWGATDPDPESSYVWPLDSIPRAITGTFMEPRSAHYHSGLDIKTEGRIGIPVHAPAAGWVSRVRASAHGYGKAIYLSTEEGRTFVLAHLSEFCAPLQDEMTKAQARGGIYEQDLRFSPGQLTFQAGDLLALSGATGTGAPHLHLEVRSAAEKPLNPLTHGFDVPDREAPTIRRFRLVPLDEEARVDGKALSSVLMPEAIVDAAGRLGLQVEVLDYTGVFRHRLAPLGVEVRLGDEVVYRMEQTDFAFSQGGQMRLEFQLDRDEPSRRWLRLYRRPGNDLPGRTQTEMGASFFLPRTGESHRVTVRAWDAAGHETEAGFFIRAGAPPVLQRTPNADLEGGTAWGIETAWDEALLQIEVVGQGNTRGRPFVQLEVPGREIPLRPAFQVTERGLLAGVETDDLGRGRHRIAVVHGGRELAETYFDVAALGGAFEWTALGPELRIADPGDGFFEGGVVRAEPAPGRMRLPEGTRRAGAAATLISEGGAFRNDLAVELLVDHPERTVGLFWRDTRGSWRFAGAEPAIRIGPDGVSRSALRGEIDRPGTVAVLEDAHPPYVGDFLVEGQRLRSSLPLLHPVTKTGPEGIRRPRWPVIELPVTDAGSGIARGGVRVQLDGHPFPARWDPEEERIYFEFFQDPGPGAHRIDVEVTDELGNSSSARLDFEFREL